MQNSTAKFITIEGIEGVGKSTCINYIARLLEQNSIQFIQTREPGGTEIAEKIRNVMLAHYEEKMADDTELLLAFASRAQHLATLIYPNLHNNIWVLSDRFTDASLAYQGGGRGIAANRIKLVQEFVHKQFIPDLTFLLHAPVELALTRAKGRGQLDRIELEKIDFFERVQSFYLQQAEAEPKRFRCIDASKPLNQVKQAINQHLHDYLESLS